eukprot:5096096-Pyramimonas_sp.AAC.1
MAASKRIRTVSRFCGAMLEDIFDQLEPNCARSDVTLGYLGPPYSSRKRTHRHTATRVSILAKRSRAFVNGQPRPKSKGGLFWTG